MSYTQCPAYSQSYRCGKSQENITNNHVEESNRNKTTNDPDVEASHNLKMTMNNILKKLEDKMN